MRGMATLFNVNCTKIIQLDQRLIKGTLKQPMLSQKLETKQCRNLKNNEKLVDAVKLKIACNRILIRLFKYSTLQMTTT